jgi:DNA-binding CsgD family transcriptional regulator
MTTGRPLLERDEQLAALGEAMDSAAAGRGSLILLGGEAGVGKTTLVRRFTAELDGIRVLTGVCDPVPTPHPLGPVLDMAPGLGPSIGRLLVEATAPREVFGAILSHLAALTAPMVLVFEDVHWADQASLELVAFLGRRVERLPALIVATYRAEEVEPGGPLAVVLGHLATTPGVRRLTVEPLSREATSRLAQGSSADVDELHRRTGGNPFFITEVLGAWSQEVPTTVRDAVLARVVRRTSHARRALEIAAAIGVRVEPGLLGRMMEATGTPRWSLQEAVDAGLLERHGPWLAFRHELAQAAIAAATPPERRQWLHAAILAELRRLPIGPDDHVVQVGHAEAAGDDGAVLELAPPAAVRAAALGAHREAAQLYGKALERGRDRPALAAGLLERRGEQRYLARRFAGAMDDHRSAATLCRDLGDRLGEGRNLVRLSYLNLAAGDSAGSESALTDATALLEALPPSRELTMAYEASARRLFMANELGTAGAWAERAVALAERLGDPALALEARITAAVLRLMAGDDAARAELRALREAAEQRSLRDPLARDTFARANFYLALIPTMRRQYEDVDRALEEGWRYALDHNLEYWQSMLAGARALRAVDAGRWREAVGYARAVLDMPDPAWRSRLMAMISLARVALRTAQPDGEAHLERVTEAAGRDRAALGIVWPARAEAGWLAGDPARVLREVAVARAGRFGAGDPWFEGELALWAHLAGAAAGAGEGPAAVAEPYRLVVAGDWAAAAAWWEGRGCPYEMAVSLAAGDEPDAVRRAIAVLDQLGASPAAAYARRRLRELGVASVPRGPRASTLADPAGLTGRERQVLDLVAAGLGNAEIAARLFLSERTVERHMAGIFAKLDVSSRADAARAGTRAGASGAAGDAQLEGLRAPD